MSDITAVISTLIILLSKLYSSSSAFAILNCLSGSPLSVFALLERVEKLVFIPVGPLYEHGRVIQRPRVPRALMTS